MRRLLLVAGAIVTLAGAGAAHATTVSDPTGDFLGSFLGNHDADLDVTSFGVTYDAATTTFTLNATLAGAINPALPGLAIGPARNRFVRTSAPAGKLPTSDADIAFAPVSQLARCSQV